MDRERYLQEVWARLSNRMPRKDLDGIMRYYEEYFDEAGPQREAEVIAELGTPEELARRILEDRTAKGRRRGGAVVAAVLAAVLLMGFAGAAWLSASARNRHFALMEPVEYVAEPGWEAWPTSVEPFTKLDVRAACGDVQVVGWDSYGVDMNGTGYWEIDDGKLVIKSEWAGSRFRTEGGQVTIYVPEGAWLDTVSIDADLGECRLESFSADSLTVKAHCGRVVLNGITVSSASLTADLGSVELCGVAAEELSVKLGGGELSGWELTVKRSLEVNSSLGSIDLSGQFLGEAYLKCDAGSISLLCWGAEEDYRYDLKTDMGSVRVNGGGGGNSVKKRSGENAITAVSSMGSITLDFG